MCRQARGTKGDNNALRVVYILMNVFAKSTYGALTQRWFFFLEVIESRIIDVSRGPANNEPP
jgi:hypothetical protein